MTWDADYVDDIVILANSPAQVETLLHSLERAGSGIDLQNRIQSGDIST